MSAYIGDVVKNGLVLYLDAANSKSYVSGSSTWFDLSGNNNSGSLTNGPTFSSDGKGNMVFDGTNDHVILARPSIMSGSQVSFCVWVNITSTRDGSIIWLEDGNDARYFSVHLTWGDNVIYFDGGNGTGTSGGVFDRINKSTTATERSGWHYWCFTKNSSTGIMRIYLDGTLWHSGTGQNAPVAAASLGLINKTDGASYVAHHRNAISSIKFYNRELSPAEILENYNATKGRFDTPRAINSVQPRLVTNGLVMSLDAGNKKSYVSGSSTIFDLSGNGYNGTLTNGPTFNSSNNGSIAFDGTNDYITRSNVIRIGGSNQKMTVEAAFFIPTGGGGWIATNERETGQTGHGWYWCTASECFYEQHATNGPPYVYRVYASSTGLSYIKTNDWNIVSWSVEVGTTSMFCNFLINGYTETVANNSIIISNETTTDDNIDIGRRRNAGYSTEYSSIRIANVRIYNRALNRNEQIQNYNALKGRFGL